MTTKQFPPWDSPECSRPPQGTFGIHPHAAWVLQCWNIAVGNSGIPQVRMTHPNMVSASNALRIYPERGFWEGFFTVLASDGSRWLGMAVFNNRKWFGFHWLFDRWHLDRVEMFASGRWLREQKAAGATFNTDDPEERCRIREREAADTVVW